jgi:hypothetical protein
MRVNLPEQGLNYTNLKGYLSLVTALLVLDVQGKWYRGVCRRVRSRLRRSDGIGPLRSWSACGSVVCRVRVKYMFRAWSRMAGEKLP